MEIDGGQGSPTTLLIALEGSNGITVAYPEYQQVCKGSFDGKDNFCTGAGSNLKVSLAFERSGQGGVKLTTKMNGKLFYVDVLALSADGKTLTDDGSPTAVKEPITAVHERQ